MKKGAVMRNKQGKPTSKSDDVGYRRPPKKFRFKPGRSGNPKGINRKALSLAADLRALLQRALNTKTRHGEHEQIVTKAAAGIEKLVTQFAAGDRHARRDLVAMAEKLGLDLTAGQHGAIEKAVTAALAAEDEAIINDFLRRHGVKPEQSAVTTDASSDQTKEANQTSKES
jgi:predicted nucleic acid-binding protein